MTDVTFDGAVAVISVGTTERCIARVTPAAGPPAVIRDRDASALDLGLELLARDLDRRDLDRTVTKRSKSR